MQNITKNVQRSHNQYHFSKHGKSSRLLHLVELNDQIFLMDKVIYTRAFRWFFSAFAVVDNNTNQSDLCRTLFAKNKKTAVTDKRFMKRELFSEKFWTYKVVVMNNMQLIFIHFSLVVETSN